LLSFYSSIFEAVDSGKDCDVVYLDFSKAFDTVPHERLLKKVEAHGIGGAILGWIRA
jgi:ribonuclease P/MRP protein subunit RPP40